MSRAREHALQFVYQCECERIYYFDSGSFSEFAEHFSLSPEVATAASKMVSNMFAKLPEIDTLIQASSNNWTIARMSVIDRTLLRTACAELLQKSTPERVILNEAIELAKIYGSDSSARFVNGVLDSVRKRLPSDTEAVAATSK
jgi:N utilization substance protein B